MQKAGACRQQGGGQQVRLDVPDAEPEQATVFDHGQHLGVGGGLRLRKVAQQPEDFAASRQPAECELADHPRVDQDVAVLQQFGKLGVAGAEVVDPDRGVDEDQPGARRLEISFTPGSLPASRDSRRALSRSILRSAQWCGRGPATPPEAGIVSMGQPM